MPPETVIAAPGDDDIAVRDRDRAGGVDAVVARCDRNDAAGDKDVPERIVVVVFGVDAVLAGNERQRAVSDIGRIVYIDRVRLRRDAERAARYRDLVLCDDAVTAFGNDCEGAAAVYCYIVAGEDRAVDVYVPVGDELADARKRVFRVFRERDEHLIGTVHEQRRRIMRRYLDAGQHDLHLFRFAGVDGDGHFGFAAEDIDAALRDRISVV